MNHKVLHVVEEATIVDLRHEIDAGLRLAAPHPWNRFWFLCRIEPQLCRLMRTPVGARRNPAYQVAAFSLRHRLFRR